MSKEKKLTEEDVIAIIADAIKEPVNRIGPNSTAAEFVGWDSMGTMVIMTNLDGYGIKLEPGDAAMLQSVRGVIEAVRKAGKFA